MPRWGYHKCFELQNRDALQRWIALRRSLPVRRLTISCRQWRSVGRHYGDDNITETSCLTFVSVELSTSQAARDNFTETGQRRTITHHP